ncbi:MAG: TraG family conjugative transposon ATPase, partial [Sphingobacteriaceae bacterium]
MKKVRYEEHYVGYDIGLENGYKYDVMVGEYGNPIIAIKLRNIVQQYSADKALYLKYHLIFQNVISIIGEGHVVQKIDVFDKKKYSAESSDGYLQNKYSEHFDGRVYKTIETVITFTHIVNKASKKKPYTYTDKKYKSLRDKVEKVYLLLDQNKFEPQYLLEADFEYYVKAHKSANYDKNKHSINNIASFATHLKIGKSFVQTISYVDVERIVLPNTIDTYSALGGNNATKDTAVDNFSFINSLEDYQNITYHQVIVIPVQSERAKFLANKRNKHIGFASEPANKIAAEEIDVLLDNVAKDGQLIVDAHFSLIISCASSVDLETTRSMIDNQLFSKSIDTNDSADNQLELFKSGLIGNATELRDYDLFTTTSEASLCFFFKESYPIDEDSPFYLRFTDRQGVPLKVDTSDLPMATNRINNRNKFVLGPSGSGKSFLMNNIVEQYLNYNYDIVIVDVGDSYSGTCKALGGKYVQYTEEKPITMNPFVMTREEFNIEKIEFLGNLIFLIWQGSDREMSTTQKSILDNLLLAYYHQFFNGGTEWYVSKSNTELILYLKKYNIYEEDILRSFEKYQADKSNYYNLLEVAVDATMEEIKKSFRRLAMIYHPDTTLNKEIYTEEKFVILLEAYETLKDEEKRKAYDELQIAQVSKVVKERPKVNSEEWDNSFRNSIIKRIVALEEKLKVNALSFNSFYEYCEGFLPIYLGNKRYKINEEEFNLRTFLYVLHDFYKGGRYGATLNESADNSLFNEKFIVFEIDNVKDNPKLFPIVTLIIMDTFIQKMRLRKDRRKALIIEEAWKAIASKLMGGYILYLYKTVRKYWGEAVVVTQELDDIIGNTVVKDSIINNSDTFLLLDQTKFLDSFDKIAGLLSLNKVEQSKIFTINNLDNKNKRSRFKEFYLKRGAVGEVYGNEVSLHQYLTYTTEKPEKSALE